MSKITALKKLPLKQKAVEPNRNSRMVNIEIPGTIMQAVQGYIKDQACSITQFWKEAASLRLQAEDMQSARGELDRILGQIAYAEKKLGYLHERDQELCERELRIEEVELSQVALHEERLQKLNQRAREQDEEYVAKMAKFREMVLKQEEEYQIRLEAIESQVRGRSGESRQNHEMDYLKRERELIRQESQIKVREEIALEKEKFWSTMYDAVVKLTRVCGAVK
jgi:hypothetical protein